MKRTYTYQVNGLEIHAAFDDRDGDRVFLPLLRRLTALQRERGRRIAVFLAAPPAAGKSTLCCYLEELSWSEPALTPVQAVGIDGFHYPQRYLDSHGLARIKGAPETYDVAGLRRMIERLNEPNQRWPVYDRRIHDPIGDAVEIAADIVIVEGNWLLLNAPPWSELRCDYSIFLRAGDRAQLERIVRRKVRGGFSEDEAREIVERNDWPNILRCMEHSRRGDLTLAKAPDGTWEEI